MSPSEIIICHFLKKYGTMVISQICLRSGLKPSTAFRASERLRDQGVINISPMGWLKLNKEFKNKIKIL